jgi:crotonobetainyl-CoA:carnitine CoA-transferase CaiB-like acyl-CoA transferase
VDANGCGLGPGYRLYQCADAAWVFLYAADQAALATLGVTDIPGLEALFRSQDAAHWTHTLCRTDLCCVRADTGWPADFLLGSELARAEELVVPAEHGQWGDYLRHGPMLRFGAGRHYPGASLAGDSTRSLLDELGYTQQQIDELEQAALVKTL